MKKLLIVLSLFLLPSCATMSVRRGISEGHPVSEAKGGQVHYCASCFFTDSRRDSAYSQMAEFCGGKYRIVKETPITKDLRIEDIIDFECTEVTK